MGAVLLLAAGCGGGDSGSDTGGESAGRSYPPAAERDFLASCQRSARAAANSDLDFSGYCRCALEGIEERESLEEFKADAAAYSRTVQIPQVWREAILSCREKIAPS